LARILMDAPEGRRKKQIPPLRDPACKTRTEEKSRVTPVGMTAIASKSRLEAGATTCWAHAEAYPTERSQQWLSRRLLFLVVPGEAAVDEKGRAGGIRGFVGGEEDGHGGDVFRLAEAFQRNVFEKRAEFCRVV